MNDVSRATVADLPGLVALEECFPCGQRWSENGWLEELTAANRHVLVCIGDGVIRAAATFALSADVVDLHRIVTSPTARRCGLARHLMEAGRRWAERSGAARMLLEVEASNAPALALYTSQGFRVIAGRRDYYGAGADAEILELSLNEGELS